MSQYYIQENGEQKGPFSIDELKAKIIKRDTPIWREGLENWVTAINLEELKGFFKSLPPEFKTEPSKTTPPPFEQKDSKHSFSESITKSDKTSSDSKVSKKKKSNMTIILTIVVLFGTAVALLIINKTNGTGYSNNDYSTENNYETKKQSVAEIEASNPLKFLKADGYYNQNLLGTKLKVDGEIHNSATTTSYKDIVVRVYFYSKTKTLLGSEDYTIYEVVKPNHSKGFNLKVTNYKDVNSIGWDVVSAKVY